MNRRCPVCFRRVRKTMHDCIEGHWDTAGAVCVGGGEPYFITLAMRPPKVVAA